MEEIKSEDVYLDDIAEKYVKKKRFLMRDEDFVKIIQPYPCLMEKSQAPQMKVEKHNALQAVEKKIKKIHGIVLSRSQLRKKIENMKGRIRAKHCRNKAGNRAPIPLKPYEKQLLRLMDSKDNSRQVFKKIPVAELCAVPDTSDDWCDVKVENVVLQEQQLPEPPPQLWDDLSAPKRSTQNNDPHILELQREVLMEQRQLNQQQKELNIQQKAIFDLQIEKLLLEINLLKNKLN